VQVLKGPQGTLFGRNATVGAVSLHTYAPSTSGFSARLAAQAGDFGSYQGEGMANLPLTQDFAVRLAALANTTDGFVENRLDGHTYGQSDTVEGRLSAKWTPTQDITWIGRADWAHTSGDGVAINQVDTSTATPTQLAAYTARLGGNPTTLSYPPSFTTNQKFDNLNLSDIQWGVASDLTWNFAGGYALRLMQDADSLDFRTRRLNELNEMLRSSRRERFAYAEKLTDRKKEAEMRPRATLQIWLAFWRDVLLCRSGASAPLAIIDRTAEIEALAQKLSLEEARQLVVRGEEAIDQLDQNVNARLLTEVLLLDWPHG
jgi:outer membrane receptor protein involved in Fe transport